MQQDTILIGAIVGGFVMVGWLLVAYVRSEMCRRYEGIESEYRYWRGNMGNNRQTSDEAAEHVLELGRRWSDEDLGCTVRRSLCVFGAVVALLGALALLVF